MTTERERFAERVIINVGQALTYSQKIAAVLREFDAFAALAQPAAQGEPVAQPTAQAEPVLTDEQIAARGSVWDCAALILQRAALAAAQKGEE